MGRWLDSGHLLTSRPTAEHDFQHPEQPDHRVEPILAIATRPEPAPDLLV